MNVCERGIAAMLAGELEPGQTVEVELMLSPEAEPLRANATVKYHDKLRCGFEFVEISAEQRVAIRDWAKEAKAETEVGAIPNARVNRVVVKHIPTHQGSFGGGGSSGQRQRKSLLIAGMVVLTLAAFVGGVFWWRWTSGWEELESGRKGSNNTSTARLKVPTEAMQKLLVHRVDPVYPAEARQQNLQGIIALDIVVGPDGSVVSTRRVERSRRAGARCRGRPALVEVPTLSRERRAGDGGDQGCGGVQALDGISCSFCGERAAQPRR